LSGLGEKFNIKVNGDLIPFPFYFVNNLAKLKPGFNFISEPSIMAYSGAVALGHA
jgi:hypothetical protein